MRARSSCSGCGGEDPTSSDAAADTSAAASDTASDTAFCDQASGIDDRVDAAVADLDGAGSMPEAFRRLAEELRAIEAPASLAADWATMAGGLDGMADALADVDLTDLSTLEALDAAEGDLSDASTHVETYLHDECGIDP